MVTMKDIAEYAGVSKATVSKIINGRDDYISDATREKVLRLIEEYHYRPNALAKGLKIKKTNTIGFILPDIANPFFPEIARGIEDIAKNMGFAVVFCDTDNDPKREKECFSFLKAKMVDGLIFTKALKKSQFEEYLRGNIPIVVVDRNVEVTNAQIGKVFVNSEAAIFASTEYLIKRGGRKIAFISAVSSNTFERFDGYCKALKKYGIELNMDIVYCGDYDVKTGYSGTKIILEKTEADGIVCGNDMIATGARHAAAEMGKRVPEDIKIIGMDNIYFSQFLTPTLTTVAQPAYEMGRVAAKMLINHILDGTELFEQELEYQLIIRNSA